MGKRNMSCQDGIVEVKEEMQNLNIKGTAKGGENKYEAIESNLERGKADVAKEVVESEGKDLSLPPKDECKESSITEEEENSENKNPTTGSEAAKKNKKKKKKAAPATSDEAVDKKGDEVKKEVLGEIVNNNEGENAAEVEIVCAFCKKPNPTKRCSKRHPKCLKKLFCSETCEALAHEDKKAAAVKKQAASKAAAAKKATKVKNWKNTDSGQFWWHDQ